MSLWFITTDMKASAITGQDTTLYVKKWADGDFTNIYTNAVDLDHEWSEPPIAVYARGDLTIIALQHTKIYGGPLVTQVLTFSGEILLYDTELNPGSASFDTASFNVGQWAIIDSDNRIHVVATLLEDGTYTLYDFISTDSGNNFTKYAIRTQTLAVSTPVWLCEKTDGTLYIAAYEDDGTGKVYSSDDDGATWDYEATLPINSSTFGVINDEFFLVAKSGDWYVGIFTTDDLTNWGTAVWTSNIIQWTNHVRGAALAFDGTYYYVSISTSTTVYFMRSTSPTGEWTQVGTLTSIDLNIPMARFYSQLLVGEDGTLYYNRYYGQSNSTNRYITFWTSADDGANWVAVTTPFWDAINGSDPGGDTIPWYSCLMGIVLTSGEGPVSSRSPSESPSRSTSGSPSESPSSSPSLSPSSSQSPSNSPSKALMPINPYVMLSWSDDGGMTWSNEYWRPVGKVGEHRKRLIWRQLGRAKDRVFKVAVSDPCKWIFIDSWIDAEEGTGRR